MSPMNNLDENALRHLMALPIGSWSAADVLAAREGLGLTQAELATAIGYERSAFAKIESGDAAPRRVVELAVRYLVDRRPKGAEFEVKHPRSSRFRPPGTAIGINESGFPGGASVEVRLTEGSAVWLRLLPRLDPGRRWSIVELKKAATQGGFPLVQLIDGYPDLGFVRGVDGFGVFAVGDDRSKTTAVSYIFETGEIWSVDTYIIDAVKRAAQEQQPSARPGIPYLEDRFKAAIYSFRILLVKLGLPPQFQWIAGVEGIKDCGVYFPAPTGHYFPVPVPRGPSLVEAVSETGAFDDTDTPATALKPFFKKMFNSFATERPEYLDGLSNPR